MNPDNFCTNYNMLPVPGQAALVQPNDVLIATVQPSDLQPALDLESEKRFILPRTKNRY